MMRITETFSHTNVCVMCAHVWFNSRYISVAVNYRFYGWWYSMPFWSPFWFL